MAIEMDNRLRIVEKQVDTHEAVCAERYKSILTTHSEIKHSMAKSDALLIKIGLALMGGMALILGKMVLHGSP